MHNFTLTEDVKEDKLIIDKIVNQAYNEQHFTHYKKEREDVD